MAGPDQADATGPWDNAALAQFREWEPSFVDQCLKMSNEPWTSGVLPRKDVELISLAVNAACTNLSPEGTRRHIRGALAAGATRDEILMIIEDRVPVGDPYVQPGRTDSAGRSEGGWCEANAKRSAHAGLRQDESRGPMEFGVGRVPRDRSRHGPKRSSRRACRCTSSGVLSPKLAELLSIAVDASITHMYAPGTRRHIQTALKLGATVEEIMEVFKICVAQGLQASNLGVPILAEELQRSEASRS